MSQYPVWICWAKICEFLLFNVIITGILVTGYRMLEKWTTEK